VSNAPGPSRVVLASPSEAALRLPTTPRSAEAHEQVVTTTRPPRDYFLRRALATADLLAVLGAGAVALLVVPRGSEHLDLLWLLPTLPVWLVLFRLYGLYERDVKRVNASALDDLPALFHAFVLGTLLLWVYLKLLSGHGLDVGEALTFGVSGIVIACAFRVAARRAVLKFGGPVRVLLVGQSAVTEALVRKVRCHPEYGLEPVGSISIGEQTEHPSDLPNLGRLGELDFRRLVVAHGVERVIVTAQDLSDEAMMDLVRNCATVSVKVSLVPDHINALGPSVAIDDVEGLTILGLNPLVLSSSSRLLKRLLDVAGATVGLLLASPLLLVIAIAIKLDSPGPVLFRQRRIGRGGKPFTVLKFRTMVVDAEARMQELRAQSSDPDWLKLDHDPRITRVGHLLRSTSLDELPQLWNVLTGEMSLVGPRPLIGSEDEQVAGWSRTRLDLAPGVTGMWQVLGRTDIPFRDMVSLDYLYVTNWSLWLDVKLIARTIPAVLIRRGAN
jgi:exopolysaccharide biosynthesis polyprenyl glycosylphosphotransferase